MERFSVIVEKGGRRGPLSPSLEWLLRVSAACPLIARLSTLAGWLGVRSQNGRMEAQSECRSLTPIAQCSL